MKTLIIKICYKCCVNRGENFCVYENKGFELTFEGDAEDPCEAQFEAFMERWKTKGVFKHKDKFIPFHHIIDIETLSI